MIIRICLRLCWSLLIGVSQSANASTYAERLNRTLEAYQAIPASMDVKRLVDLDGELSALAREIEQNDVERQSGSIWKPEYEAIGVYVGHYTDRIGYSGKLLVEAHRLNPDSPYRKYTLFSTIRGEGSSHGLGEMPDLAQAYQYLREFPDGPFAAETYSVLGTFHSDLFKVLKDVQEDPEGARDFTYECFAPYIATGSYESQSRMAQALAVEYLGKAISIGLANSHHENILREELDEIRRGTPTYWSWCAD